MQGHGPRAGECMTAIPTVVGFTPPVQPDVNQALAYFTALFPSGGLIHMRSVAEPKDGRPSNNHHYQIDAGFRATLAEFLTYCQVDQRAAYVLPGTVKPAGTGKADVLTLPAALVDFDKGDTSANLAAAEELLGRATVVVESGGSTDTGPKLHAYWRLAAPASGAQIDEACRIREELAKRFGGDTAFKQAGQVIRIPGSIHFKGAPKLVQLRAVRPSAVYELSALSRTVGVSEARPQTSDNFFDFNNVVPIRESHVDRVMTAPIRAEGKDDLTRFEGAATAIGHFIRQIREGRMTEEQAWEATRGWNAATLQPPWSDERLRTDFNRLLHIDVETHGPLVAPSPVFSVEAPPEGWTVLDWRADRFQGSPPVRRWLVEGIVPAGTPGIFAAVGDVGKSMLALRLALVVSSYPEVATTADSPAGFSDTPCFFGQPILGRGAAVVLTAEDDADEVHRRIAGLDPSNIRLGKPLFVVPLISTGGARAILTDGRNGPEPTPFWHELRTQLLAMPDLRLVVLDPLSSFVAADINKDNLAGAALMSMLAELAATTGAAVMLVHHFAKAGVPTSLTDARTAIRGAGALVDNGRWALVLWEADQDDAYKALKTLGQKERAKQSGIVYLGGLAKGNAPGAKVLRTLVRNGTTGLLEDVTGALQAAAPRKDELDDAILQALRLYKNKHPRWTFATSENSLWTKTEPVLRRLGVSIHKKPLVACIERLIERGLVVEADKPGQYEPTLE
jgi:hypothetical protein